MSTRLCLMRTRRWRRLIKIAEGRTRIWGNREESIFLRSRGSRPYYTTHQHRPLLSDTESIGHTLAISSDFLNSPSMKLTFPFSSNSVHRSFNSFAPFTNFLRPRVVLPASSKKLGGASESLGFKAGFSVPHLSFHGLLHWGRVSVDAYREELVFSKGKPKGASKFLLPRAAELGDPRPEHGLRKSRLRRDDST